MDLQNRELKLGMDGEDINRLQKELRQLGYRILDEEWSKEYFGETTLRAVQDLQKKAGLEITGMVDESFAKVIKAEVENADERPVIGDYLVQGHVRDQNGNPIAGLIIHALDLGPRGENPLGEAYTDEEGFYKVQFSARQFRPASKETGGPNLLVRLLNPAGELLASSKVLENAGKVETLDLVITDQAGGTANPADIIYRVSGAISSAQRAGVGGLRVLVVDKNVGADVQLGETSTDAAGRYSLQFKWPSRRKQSPDLQTRAFAGPTFLAASVVRYNASLTETLDIALPASASPALPSEYESLTAAIARHYTGPLGSLQESADQQDITFLANKTGWDARAVALVALADQFSARTSDAQAAVSIQPAFYYALFRSGLPANEAGLYHASAGMLTAVWNKAIEQGVIAKDLAPAIPQAVQQFQALSAQHLLSNPAIAGVSSLKELLGASNLNADQQTTFAELYTAQGTDPTAFWKAVGEAFGSAAATRLQLDGKLGFLTINNLPLMQKLHGIADGRDISDPLQLAQAGYFRAGQWDKLLAGQVPIPPEIPGDTPEAKRANYADYLAAQMRLSYPTTAVAEMVRSGDLPLPGAAQGVPDQVHTFLTENQGQFEIGMQPVQQYIAHNNLNVAEEVVTQVKRLQRVYQITPNDQAMTGLLARGLDAAYHVVRYARDAFVQSFASDLGGADIALQTYDRATQVHNAVLNIVISYQTARNGIALGAFPLRAQQNGPSGGQILQPAPQGGNAGDVIAYPTLEGLFGGMDFCDCDHCRSVLSPAAYLVDLLQFIDIDPSTLPAGTESPQAVLLERRPDVQHLPLTCENTNTALPYIDVVNETLEYFIANSTQALSLKDYMGHDTGSAASEDLLASPQFVMDSAYTTLLGERFPAPLPFHQPLEDLRRYFKKFQVPLPLALERLRKDDSLERSLTNPYGWRDILMEELLLSPQEYEIFTDSAAAPLWRVYGFVIGTSDADVIATLSNAQQFTRRVGITYTELVDILQTRFVNPNSDLIPKLDRLGVSFADLKTLKDTNTPAEDAAFDALLPTGVMAPDPAEYAGDIQAWVRNVDNYSRIMALITLTDPTGSGQVCNFDTLEFRYATPMANTADTSTRLGAVEFMRLIRFIRLWKKAGWNLQQTDAAICALFPLPAYPLGADAIDSLAKLDAGFKTLLPELGIIARMMTLLNLKPEHDLLPVLTCWSPIGTHADASLYRQMFLNPAVLKQDNVFADNGYGEFLADNTIKLADHAAAVRSAFNLTGDEYDRIAAALGYDANTLLTIPNISAIYRRGMLARKMKLSVRELLLLMQFSGLDPFVTPDPTSPAVLQVIALVQALKNRSLKPSAALYLIWNQDLSGKSGIDPAQVVEFARTLRADFSAIEDQFAVVQDPNGDIVRARMTLVYGQEPADSFFALLDDTIALDVSYTNPTPTLAASITAADLKIAYDDFNKRLSYTGVLTTTQRDALKLAAGVTLAFKQAVDALYSQSEDAKGSFFTRYPELKPLYDAYIVSMDPPAVKRTALLAAFQPELSRRRKTQQAQQRMSAAAAVDLVFTQLLLDPTIPAGQPYPLHAAGHPDQPALNDILALETPGLAAQFFYRDTATLPADLSLPAEAQLDYNIAHPLPPNPAPGSAISGIWSGQVEIPEAGYYNFIIEADAAATVTLSLGGSVEPLTQNGNLWRNTDPLSLQAGTLYPIVLTVEKVRDVLSFKWETPKQPRALIPARYLYPPAILPPFSDVYIRFLKVASLAAGLNLTANELAHFAVQADYQIAGDGWLNVLPVSGDPALPVALALLKPFQALLDFSRIKAALSPTDEQVLTFLKDPVSATSGANALLFQLTRWDAASLTALLGQFGMAATDLSHLESFRRVYDAFTIIQQMGISGSALIQATTNQPTGAIVRDLQSALRALYDSADWRTLVQPINDEMRTLQRDALVAYILHQMLINPATAHIDTADKLFEYFLMDVEMEPCMETSRIRHALSSVQLFIERCQMNLEPRVAPSTINAKQWEWMKRYRVWEANRKVFLFPENWLEPELRDDKSPFFKEIESELLQSDITDDSATTALLNYLAKLEEVAKLEPCGIYHVEGDPSKRTGDVDHVIARTAGAHRKYYYRRHEYGYWTPWEQIKLEIEDNPVVPVVWNDRLLLFWLRIVKKAPLDVQKPGTGNVALTSLKTSDINTAGVKVTIQAVLSWSEYYNGKWQAAKTSNIDRPTDLGQFDPTGDQAFDRSALSLSIPQNDDTLIVSIDMYHSPYSWFLLYNTHSLPVPFEEAQDQPIPLDLGPGRFFGVDNGVFPITYHVTAVSGPWLIRDVLKYPLNFKTTAPLHPLKNTWDAPFFYDDRRNVFFVTTTERQVLIWNYPWYGILDNPGLERAPSIPPIVFKPEPQIPVGPKFWGDGAPVGVNPGVVDPAPMQKFVTEDAFIRQGIGTPATVMYGNQQIGPAGGVSTPTAGLIAGL